MSNISKLLRIRKMVKQATSGKAQTAILDKETGIKSTLAGIATGAESRAELIRQRVALAEAGELSVSFPPYEDDQTEEKESRKKMTGKEAGDILRALYGIDEPQPNARLAELASALDALVSKGEDYKSIQSIHSQFCEYYDSLGNDVIDNDKRLFLQTSSRAAGKLAELSANEDARSVIREVSKATALFKQGALTPEQFRAKLAEASEEIKIRGPRLTEQTQESVKEVFNDAHDALAGFHPATESAQTPKKDKGKGK